MYHCSLSDNMYFPFQDNAKFVMNGCNNVLRKGVNFFPGSSPMIYQDQRLVHPCTGMSDFFSFPAALLNQPTRCHFYTAVWHGKIDHIREFLPQPIEFFVGEHRILKKASRIADSGRVGQLGNPDGGNHLADIPDSRALDSALTQLHFNGAIRTVGAEYGRQPQPDRYYDESTAVPVFKDAVAISKLTLLPGELPEFSGKDIKGFQRIEDVFQLHPIGTDVLNRGRPD